MMSFCLNIQDRREGSIVNIARVGPMFQSVDIFGQYQDWYTIYYNEKMYNSGACGLMKIFLGEHNNLIVQCALTYTIPI